MMMLKFVYISAIHLNVNNSHINFWNSNWFLILKENEFSSTLFREINSFSVLKRFSLLFSVNFLFFLLID